MRIDFIDHEYIYNHYSLAGGGVCACGLIVFFVLMLAMNLHIHAVLCMHSSTYAKAYCTKEAPPNVAQVTGNIQRWEFFSI